MQIVSWSSAFIVFTAFPWGVSVCVCVRANMCLFDPFCTLICWSRALNKHTTKRSKFVFPLCQNLLPTLIAAAKAISPLQLDFRTLRFLKVEKKIRTVQFKRDLYKSQHKPFIHTMFSYLRSSILSCLVAFNRVTISWTNKNKSFPAATSACHKADTFGFGWNEPVRSPKLVNPARKMSVLAIVNGLRSGEKSFWTAGASVTQKALFCESKLIEIGRYISRYHEISLDSNLLCLFLPTTLLPIKFGGDQCQHLV